MTQSQYIDRFCNSGCLNFVYFLGANICDFLVIFEVNLVCFFFYIITLVSKKLEY